MHKKRAMHGLDAHGALSEHVTVLVLRARNGPCSPATPMTTSANESPRSFLQSGHLPTLIAALLYFDVSFMAWVVLGPLAPFIRDSYSLSPTEQGFLISLPLLGGSLFRPILGALADRIGGRRTGMLGLVLTLVPLVAGWTMAETTAHLYAVGFLLGIAGASFAVALPLASRWYPPEHQGLAMGIAGAGNSGTVLATLLAPRLAERFGWAATLGLVALPVLAALVCFALMARDSPRRAPAPAWRDYTAVLGEPDTLWFSLLYGLTFGGFVGLTSFLPTYFNDEFHVSRVAAGDFTTMVVVAGSLLRPVGGWLADKIGGYRLLLMLLGAVSVCLSALPGLGSLAIVIPLLFVALGLLGMGNGAVFQLVPQRFGDRMGLVTGIVGAAGGLGGFFLPLLLGIVRDWTGSYAAGLLLCASCYAAGALLLLELGTRWANDWGPHMVKHSGVFCYRGWWRAAVD